MKDLCAGYARFSESWIFNSPRCPIADSGLCRSCLLDQALVSTEEQSLPWGVTPVQNTTEVMTTPNRAAQTIRIEFVGKTAH